MANGFQFLSSTFWVFAFSESSNFGSRVSKVGTFYMGYILVNSDLRILPSFGLDWLVVDGYYH